MILRTVRALISLTVRAACKITTSNKPRVNKPTAAKTFISTTVLLETFIFATFYHCPYVYSTG